jgi:hypothetical protein
VSDKRASFASLNHQNNASQSDDSQLLSRYVIRQWSKRRGRWIYYWNVPTWARVAGCPFQNNEVLGDDYDEVVRRVERVLLPALDAWRSGEALAAQEGLAKTGTLDWLFGQYRADRKFTKLPTGTRRDKEGHMRLAAGYLLSDGRRLGTVKLGSITTAVVDTLSPYGRIYNSRAGLGAYYRYGPRRLDPPRDWRGARIPKPKIHETVLWRIAMGTDAYAPLSLPNGLQVVTDCRSDLDIPPAGAKPNILNFKGYLDAVTMKGDMYGAPAGKDADNEKRKRAADDFGKLQLPNEKTLELIWDTVWWRRVSYFFTLFMTASLLVFPALFPPKDGFPPTDGSHYWASRVRSCLVSCSRGSNHSGGTRYRYHACRLRRRRFSSGGH